MSQKVSVIIPFYNCQRYLAACIDSVLAQRGADLEVLLVNDGSTDLSATIAQAYARSCPQVKYLSQQNAGPGAARNKALDAATGEYVAFVDGDDELLPGALLMLLAQMEPSVDMAVGRYVRRLPLPRHSGHPVISTVSASEAKKRMLYQRGFTSALWGNLYRRSSIGSLRMTEGIYYEDLDFLASFLSSARKVSFINLPTYYYRFNPDSAMNVWSDRRLDVMDVTSRLEKGAASADDEALLAAARDRRLSASFNMFILCSKHHRYAVASQCWSEIKRLRSGSLRNPRVRLKNRVGALISYLGPGFIARLGSLLYR